MKLRLLFETEQSELQRWIPALKVLRRAISNRFRQERARIDRAKMMKLNGDDKWWEYVIRDMNDMWRPENTISTFWLSQKAFEQFDDLMGSSKPELTFHVDDEFKSHDSKEVIIRDDHVEGDIKFPKEIEEVLVDMMNNLKRATYNYAMETDET